MKSVRRFAALLLASTVLASSAFAVTPQAVESVKAPVAKPMSAWLVGPSQASAFDVKDHPDQAGCLMVTEFDNGMIIGVHARKAGIVGMTVDTEQKTMNVGDARTIGMNIGSDAYVLNGVATDASTLAVGLDEAGGGQKVAERLTTLGNFRLLIDQKPYYFATTGFTDGLARLQACMGSNMAVPVVMTGPGDTVGKITYDHPIETMKVTSSGNATPLALAMPNLVPPGYRFVLEDVDPMTPLNWQAGEDWVVVMQKALAPHDLKMTIKGNTIRITQRTGDDDPVIEDEQFDDKDAADATVASADVPEGVWGGAAGENLADVLDAWGLMAGVNVKTDLVGDLKLPRDVRYQGRFDDAVQKLLAQFTGSNKPVGKFGNMNLTPVSVTEKTTTTTTTRQEKTWKPRPPATVKTDYVPAPLKQMRTIPDPADAPKTVKKEKETPVKASSAKKSKVKTSGTWEALQGTSLRDVLEHWGRDAGVSVIYMADENYPLPESIKKKGKFEEAVMDALSQYEDQGTRPTAQLNSDPKTGERALIVKGSRG